jgi:hypothetical protein
MQNIASIFNYLSDIIKTKEFHVFIMILSLLFIGFSFYYLLSKWRSLPVSLKSLIFFLINYTIVILYTFSFILLKQGLPSAIYLEDLSKYSQYKYLLLVLIGFLGILVYTLARRSDVFQSVINIILYPYLKEEVRIILYTWNETLFGPLWSFMITKLSESLFYRIIYFLTHSLLTYVIPVILNIFFVKFVFLHGDLRNLIYMIPITFICWLFSFLDYYFQEFLAGCSSYIRLLLNVNLKKDNTAIYPEIDTITVNSDDLTFSLSAEAFVRGFSKVDLVNLRTEWLLQAKVNYIFSTYKKYTRFVSYLNSFIRFFCWIFITLYFFTPLENTFIISGGWDTAIGCLTRNSPFKTSTLTRMPLEAFRIKPQENSASTTATNTNWTSKKPLGFTAVDLQNNKDTKEEYLAESKTHFKKLYKKKDGTEKGDE